VVVQQPLNLGGLGIPDLWVMGLALWLRWLNISKVFFRALISCLVGNGEETLF
jgi:hypothetical protein